MAALTDQYLSIPAGTLRVLGLPAPLKAGLGGKPLVLCLHGIMVTADMWRPNLPALITAGYPALAIDLPGHGRSYRPARPLNIADLARVVDELLTTLGAEEVCLVGNSLGGAVASEVALLRPERIARLVLVDALGLDPDIALQRPWSYWRDLVLPALALPFVGQRAWIRRRVGRVLFHNPARVPPEVLVMEHGRGWQENYGGRLKVGWGVLRQLAPAAARRAFVQRRAGLTAPTLIVWGDSDQLLPVSHAHTARALIPGARLHIFERCGHAPNIEYPDEFNRLVMEFISSGETGA